MNTAKNSKHNTFTKLSFLLIFFVLIPCILAQKEETGCELGRVTFDDALIEATDFPDSYLIIIAHRGKGEKTKINQYRLKLLEDFAKQKSPKVNYLFAEGSFSEGLGRIDLYVGGKLYRQIYFDKNAKTFCSKP